jgi:hypothetical protein
VDGSEPFRTAQRALAVGSPVPQHVWSVLRTTGTQPPTICSAFVRRNGPVTPTKLTAGQVCRGGHGWAFSYICERHQVALALGDKATGAHCRSV